MINILITDFGLLCIVHYIGSILFKYRTSFSFMKRLLVFIIFFVMSFFVNGTGNITHQSTILLTILYFFYLIFQFHTSFIVLILTIVFILLIGYASEILSVLIYDLLSSVLFFSDINSLFFGITLIINFSLSFLYANLIKLFTNHTLPKYSWCILIFPFITVVSIFQIGNYFELVRSYKNIVLVFVGLLISNYLTLFFFYKSIQSVELKNELMNELNRQENLKIQNELINQFYQTNFYFLHDLLHRGNRMYQHITENNFEKVQEELLEMNDITFREFNAIYSNNMALNLIINKKLDRIRSFGLDIRTEILSNIIELSLSEQIDFFDSLLDIVLSIIEEQKIENPSLFIRFSHKGQSSYMKIVFSSFNRNEVKEKEISEYLEKYSISVNSRFDVNKKLMQWLLVFNS